MILFTKEVHMSISIPSPNSPDSSPPSTPQTTAGSKIIVPQGIQFIEKAKNLGLEMLSSPPSEANKNFIEIVEKGKTFWVKKEGLAKLCSTLGKVSSLKPQDRVTVKEVKNKEALRFFEQVLQNDPEFSQLISDNNTFLKKHKFTLEEKQKIQKTLSEKAFPQYAKSRKKRTFVDLPVVRKEPEFFNEMWKFVHDACKRAEMVKNFFNKFNEG